MGIIPLDEGLTVRHVLGMFDWKTRLRTEIEAQKTNMKAVSLKAGLGETYVRDILTRRGGGNVEGRQAIAEALNKPKNWLIDESEQPGFREPPAFMNDRDMMPVFASAEGGNGALIVSTSEIDRVPRPYTLEGVREAYAILVTGESMVPAYEPGDYAWVNPRLPPMRETDCILYEIDGETGDARATIKRLISWTPKSWNLRQWNPRKDFQLDRSIWNKHHRVVGNFRRR